MQEHPILRQPCYVLHPCQTAEVMGLMKPSTTSTSSHGRMLASMDNTGSGGSEGASEVGRAVEYLKAWFSVYGCAVGLKLPKHLWP